jgi:hypothetical protein
MSSSHRVNKVNLIVQKINHILSELFSAQNGRLPVDIRVIDLLVSQVAFKKAGRPMLFHKIAVDIGVNLEIIPTLSVDFQIVVAMGQFVGSLLVGNSVIWLKGVQRATDAADHQGDY